MKIIVRNWENRFISSKLKAKLNSLKESFSIASFNHSISFYFSPFGDLIGFAFTLHRLGCSVTVDWHPNRLTVWQMNITFTWLEMAV